MAKPHETRDHTTWQEHPMVTELLAELHEIDEKERVEIRFYEIIAWASHIDMAYQYESASFATLSK